MESQPRILDKSRQKKFFSFFPELNRKYFLLLFLLAYLLRLGYGLSSEFWFVDEKQVYLLGLKFYATGEWPFLGPDVVYTNSQVPGALQALLVGIPFFLLHIPEAPYLLLNLLSLASLGLLAWYCSLRTPEVPRWFIWSWLLTAPWTLNYSTHIINPSYVLAPAILFFIGILESIPSLSKNIMAPKWAAFLAGFSFLCLFQLHLSWPILVPFLVLALFFQWRSQGQKILVSLCYFITGSLLSGSLVLPTFIKYGLGGLRGVGSNIQVHLRHLLEFFTVLARFLSFASFELPRFVGANTAARLEFFKHNFWLTPMAVFVGIIGLLQPLAMIVIWFTRKPPQKDWKAVKYFTFFTLAIVYLSFAFSIKGPSSHTFYVVLPVAMIYSFYCWSLLFSKKAWPVLAVLFILSGIIFQAGLALSRASDHSLYENRKLVVEALEKKDYRILGERPPGHY
jgi:hypothetical protein